MSSTIRSPDASILSRKVIGIRHDWKKSEYDFMSEIYFFYIFIYAGYQYKKKLSSSSQVQQNAVTSLLHRFVGHFFALFFVFNVTLLLLLQICTYSIDRHWEYLVGTIH